MKYVTRLGTMPAKQRYPLPLSDKPEWEGHGTGVRCRLALPDVPADHIIVPSFAALDTDAHHRFSLEVAQTQYRLQRVPGNQPEHRAHVCDADHPPRYGGPQPGDAAANHIDCWHTHQALTGASVVVHVDTAHPPQHSLLCISVRPLRMEVAVTAASVSCARPPAAISQMQATAALRQRICSPTALAMAMDAEHALLWWPLAVAACYDPLSRAYGSWPLAIRWAASRNTLAAVEALADWDEIAAVLDGGRPIVCSIDFAADALQGAPLQRTGGHLVVLHRIAGDKVCVYDPAAPTHESVPRTYDTTEFAEAWLRNRGAAYIFAA